MKLYNTPKIGIVRLPTQDVICASNGGEQKSSFGENFVFDDLT